MGTICSDRESRRLRNFPLILDSKCLIMGAVKKYPYPKYVWSPSGGWWCQPRNWKRNTAFAFIATAVICVPVVWFDLKREQRLAPPPHPVPSQRWAEWVQGKH